MVTMLNKPGIDLVTPFDWNALVGKQAKPANNRQRGVPFNRLSCWPTAKRRQEIFCVLVTFEGTGHRARAGAFAGFVSQYPQAHFEVADTSIGAEWQTTRVAISTHDHELFMKLFLAPVGETRHLVADVRYHAARRGDPPVFLTPAQKLALMPPEQQYGAPTPQLSVFDLPFGPSALNSEPVYYVCASYEGADARRQAYDYARWVCNYRQANVDVKQSAHGCDFDVVTYTHDPSILFALFLPPMSIARYTAMQVRWHKPVAAD